MISARENAITLEAMRSYRPPRIPYLSIRGVVDAYLRDRIDVEGLEAEIERLLAEGEGVEYDPRYLSFPEFIDAFHRPYD